jgi:hypothetical protein
VYISGLIDAGIAHGCFDAFGDLLHHGGSADVFRQQLGTHGGADRKPRFGRRTGFAVPRKHGCVRSDHAVAAARPDHGNLRDLCFGALSVLHQHAAKRLVRQNAREVVDPAIALGFSNDRDHLVCAELTRLNAVLQCGGVLHVLDLDLCNLNCHVV